MEHDQALEPDPLVEVGQEGVDRGRLGRRRCRRPRRAPCRGRNPAARRRRPRATAASRIPASSVTSVPARSRSPASSRGRPSLRRDRRRPRRGRQREPVGESAGPGLDAGVTMRPDVDVDEPPEIARGRPQVAREDLDRPLEESSSGPGEVDEVRGVDGDRPDVELGQAGPERGLLARRLDCRRRQAVGLSPKIWSASAPISWARSTALTIPPPRVRWAPSRRPSGSIRGIVRRAQRSCPRAVPVGRSTKPQRRPDEARAGVPRGLAALGVVAADDGSIRP